ncbi:MAG: hypothetical protein WAL97_05130 [Halobacteriota archaeon]
MLDAELISRLDSLIREGQFLAPQFQKMDVNAIYVGQFIGWKASALALLIDILPHDHTYIQEFQKTINERDLTSSYIDGSVNILERLSKDISAGYLVQFKVLVSAEVFSDFIEMSKHLFDRRYRESAAALSTAVLEDALRHIASKNNVTFSKKDTLGPLNDKCIATGAYTSFWHKKILLWVGIRNHVDHGEFAEFAKIPDKEIEDMIDGIEDFLTQYYT